MKMIRTLICIALALALLTGQALAFEGLKKGDCNAEVQALQLRLGALGYSVGTVDADYGGKTVKAVEAFQRDRGLEVTGAVDEATWSALYDEKVVISKDGCEAEVRLTPPFTSIAVDPDGAQTAVFGMEDVQCYAEIVFPNSSVIAMQETADRYFKDELYADAEKQYQAADYQRSTDLFDIDGRIAVTLEASFDYVYDKSKLTRHILWGAVDLGEVDGQPVALRANMAFSTSRGAEIILTIDSISELLAGAHLVGAEPEEEPILGDWYGIQNDERVKLTFSKNTTYNSESETGSNSWGNWSKTDDGYDMDGKIPVTLEGDELVLHIDDITQVFTREIPVSPNRPVQKAGVTEADFQGEWRPVAVSLDGLNGERMEGELLDEIFGKDIVIGVKQGTLTADSADWGPEEYVATYENGELYVAGDGQFDDCWMAVTEEDQAVLYRVKSIYYFLEKVE